MIKNRTSSSSGEDWFIQHEFNFKPIIQTKVETSPIHTELEDEDWNTTPKLPTIPKHSMFQFEYHDAEIVVFRNLSKFFIRLVNDEKEQEVLDAKMQKFYGKSENQHQLLPACGRFAAYQVDGVWRRCVIQNLKLSNRTCNIFLLDLGIEMVVPMSDLKSLSAKFYDVKQAAVECNLGYIEPMKQFQNNYPEKAVKEFKKYAIDSKFKMRIMVTQEAEFGGAVSVVVHVIPNNRKSINLNAMLAVKLKLAKWTGFESPETISQGPGVSTAYKTTSKITDDKETRVKIVMLDIFTPSEFYAALSSRQSGK